MDPTVTDVQQTLAYGRQKMNRKWFGTGLVSLAAGALILYLGPDSLSDWFMIVLAFVLGGFLVLYALFRTLVPGKPKLVLSPKGIRINIEWVKDIDIPWQEVRGVDTIDIRTTLYGYPVELLGVTVVLVSRAFYDGHIYIRSWVLRGPGWEANFIPKGSMVQVALQHEALPVEGPELRAAVEARWHAFRGAERTASA
jgi:hypothetical protein